MLFSNALRKEPALDVASIHTGPQDRRTFLVVVDNTTEMNAALRFACRRAVATGDHIALLYVSDPAEFEHFMFVGARMRNEARETAEEILQRKASLVRRLTGRMPGLFVREGSPTEEVLALLDEEPSISVVVLGTGTGSDGPGPLVTALIGKHAHRLTVPLTLVPGSLTDDEIDALT
jgi:nucleotide-binding universal stress UspA family protein